MHRIRLSAVAVALLVAVTTVLLRAQSPAPPKPDPLAPRAVPGRVLVKMKPGVSESQLGPQHAAIGARVLSRLGGARGQWLVMALANSAASVDDAVRAYRASSLVDYAEPDYLRFADQTQNVPNDLSSTLWGLHNTGQSGGVADADIDAPEAWSTAFDSSFAVVGVVDTGVDYTHPDLAQNMWTNPGEIPGDGIDNDNNGYVDDVYGINCITGAAQPGNPMDDNGHGTHVSGTIGAVGNNGIGVVGVAWTARIMALKFLSSSGSGSTSDAIRCIDYARSKGAKVLNNSWGGGGFSQALYDAINATRTADMIFVAAAGNSAANVDATAFYPAAYALDNLVSVAATTRTDALASFSNYGSTTVDLGAPGDTIYSTYPGGGYATMSGTSMATPHVTGAVALLHAYRTDLTTYSARLNQLFGTVDPLPSLAGKTRTGGRLNLNRALTGTPAPLAQLTASPNSGDPGVVVTFTDTSFGAITSRSLNFGDGSPATSTTNTTHQYTALGTYTATLTVTGSGGTTTSQQRILVQSNYTVSPTTYAWVSTAGFSSLALTDDSASGAITLPFTFSFYGQNYSTIYIGSNGVLTLGNNAGATSFSNTTLPATATPNAAIYPYWDDLNPAAGGLIKYGTAGDGSFVVSWEGVPPYAATAAPLTFQAVLQQDGSIVIQYFEVQPANSNGGGRSATVGIEDGTGLLARGYSYNGTPLLANATAVRFALPVAGVPAQPTGLTATATSASAISLTWTDAASNETGYRVERLSGATFSTVATLGANVTSWQDTGLTASTSYTYRVVAFNGSGDSLTSSQASATTAAATPTAPTVAPTSLTGSSPSIGAVRLTWVDGVPNETGFSIEMSTNNRTWAQRATVAAGATSYSTTGLSSKTNYYFRVRAYNNVGYGPYSSTVNVRVK